MVSMALVPILAALSALKGKHGRCALAISGLEDARSEFRPFAISASPGTATRGSRVLMSAIGPLADISLCTAHVRFRGQSRHGLLRGSAFAVAIRGKVDMTLCGAVRAPRGVRGGHKREGIDDSVRELGVTF